MGIWNLLEFLDSGSFVGIFITLNLFLLNKDDVGLWERYAYRIVSPDPHVMFALISRGRLEIIMQRYFIYTERRPPNEKGGYRYVINAYLNRTMRSSSIKYIILFSKDLSKEEIMWRFNNRIGLSIEQMSSTNQYVLEV